MNWISETVSSPRGELSSKRVAMLIAAVSLAIACVILACAALFGHDVGVAITGVSASLAGLGGGAYIGGVMQEKKT
jgi:hypothetical protein